MIHAGTPGMAPGGFALIAMKCSGVVIWIPFQVIVRSVQHDSNKKEGLSVGKTAKVL